MFITSQLFMEIIHLFWLCEHVTPLWNRIEKMLKRQNIVPINFSIDITMALGLKQSTLKTNSLLSFCFLVARNYIWKCRANENKPTLKGYLYQLEKYYQLECSENENLRNEIKTLFPSFKI